jgi:hypothetical protein
MKIISSDVKNPKSGIFVGGQYYTADKDGVIEVPDTTGGIEDLGFKRYEPAPAKKQNSKED